MSSQKIRTVNGIPSFMVKLGKVGLENGKIYTKLKKEKLLQNKMRSKIYKSLVKEVNRLEKEEKKLRRECKKSIKEAIKIAKNKNVNNS
jgi:hypothetical protein